MTVTIDQTAINMTGKHIFKTPLTIAKFAAEMAAFAADTTMALAEKTEKKVVLKAPVHYFDSLGTDKGQMTFSFGIPANYDTMVSLIAGDDGLIMSFTNDQSGTASVDETNENWTASYNCKLGNDSFQFILHKDYLVVQNYSSDATKTAVETYIGTRTDLA